MDTVTRRLNHRLAKVERRLHLLEGLRIAYLNLDEVIRIIRTEEEPKPVLMARFKLSEEQTDYILETRLRRKESVIYLAMPDDEDKILGFCQLYPSYSSLSLKRVWILNDIYVAEDARRQLVADRLLHTAKQMAKDTNAVRMRVATSRDNEVAQKVYESIGFVEDEQFKNYVLPINSD